MLTKRSSTRRPNARSTSIRVNCQEWTGALSCSSDNARQNSCRFTCCVIPYDNIKSTLQHSTSAPGSPFAGDAKGHAEQSETSEQQVTQYVYRWSLPPSLPPLPFTRSSFFLTLPLSLCHLCPLLPFPISSYFSLWRGLLGNAHVCMQTHRERRTISQTHAHTNTHTHMHELRRTILQAARHLNVKSLWGCSLFP
jgi:hypothetical protein